MVHFFFMETWHPLVEGYYSGTESALSWIAHYDVLLCVLNGPDAADLRDALLAYADDPSQYNRR